MQIFLTMPDGKELESDTCFFFFFADGDVAVFSTCLKLRIQKAFDYYDNNKAKMSW